MAHVSLIVTATRDGSPTAADLVAVRRELEAEGHAVEVLVAVAPHVALAVDVAGSGSGPVAGPGPVGARAWEVVESTERGRAVAAIVGLQHARGERVLVVNPDRGYTVDDLRRVLEALESGRAGVVVGSRRVGGAGLTAVRFQDAALGRVFRLLTGSTDPLSGLIGLSRGALEAAMPGIRPVGSQFALELLAKARGPRLDVPARPGAGDARRGRPGFDDIRHLKHLADHRFGNVSRLLQFCVVGASGMVVDLTCYAAFQEVFYRIPWLAGNRVPPTQVPFALAIARGLAICVALVWNFSLNRRLTFSYARAGSRLRQFAAYVLSNLLGVTVSMLLSLGLPSRVAFFHDHKLVAAVVGIVAATGISFSMSRWLVFRRHAPGPPASPTPPRSARVDPALAESSPRA